MSSAKPRRQQRYEAVLGCVKHNTAGPEGEQTATIAPSQVVMHLAGDGGRFDHDAVRRSIREAKGNDDLVELDVGGTPQLVRATEPALKAVIGEQNCRDEPDLAVIEQAVAALEGVVQ